MIQSCQQSGRLFFLDNLRTFMIFLVILVHSALVYEKSGFPSTWWIVFEGSGSDMPGLLFFILDVFVMSVIFFISGYLTPKSLDSKSPVEFIRSKIKRLIIPWALAVFLMIPLYKILFLYSRNLPQEHWTTYFHFNNSFGQGWLWFLPVLFVFNMIFLIFVRLNIRPVKISFIQGMGVFLLVSIFVASAIDLVGLSGWTKTMFLDFQNERLMGYFAVFLLGVLGYRHEMFRKKAEGKIFYYIMNGIAWIPVMMYLVFFLYPFLNNGGFIISKTVHIYIKWVFFYFSMLTMLYICVKTFWLYFSGQKLMAKELNGNSYNVYIVHLPVMGALAVALSGVGIHPLLKFLILTLMTWGISNVIISVYRRIKAIIIREIAEKLRPAVLPD